MKKQTRQGVFETNSSSTHSISIVTADLNSVMDTIIPDEDGNIILSGGDFGWEQATYHDAETKANYMLVYAMDWSGDKKDEFLERLKEVIIEQTGCNDVIFKGNSSDYYEFGYIDHQSAEDHDYHYIFYDKEELRQFIFNGASYLETDNDNH
jgi:hypothetical protein